MNSKERVKIIKAEYRGYDRFLDSKVAHPEKYAVMLIPEAAALLEETPTPSPNAQNCPTSGGRKLKGQITIRMTKSFKGLLQRAAKAHNTTVQGFCLQIITEKLKGEGENGV